jgi:hypothetical protein
LKWSRPENARQLRERMGPAVDYTRRPSEDFARATIEYADETGRPLIAPPTIRGDRHATGGGDHPMNTRVRCPPARRIPGANTGASSLLRHPF